MRYAFIDAHRARYPVPAMCELLEVSRSGYHAWRGRGPSPREQENERLLMQIRAIHLASDGNYGSPRVHEELREQGNVVSLNRVRRLMKKHGIAARHRRKFRATTDSRHKLPVAPNRLGQDFVAERPDQVWLTDVTYIWTDEGWLYLACVLDLYSRLIVGWAMSERNDRHLVIAALGMAYFQRRPARGLVHHSDRGSVYCSHDYQKLLKQYGMVCSMSRKGDLLRQCADGELVQDPEGRVGERAALRYAHPGALGGLFLRRDLLQSASPSLFPGIRVAARIRAPLRGEGGGLTMVRVSHRRARRVRVRRRTRPAVENSTPSPLASTETG